MDFGFTTIPAIAVICYVVAEVAKATALDNKWLPVLCMALGGLLGIAALYIMPSYPASDILTAAAIGIASGASATALHQTGKQLSSE